MFHPSLPLSLYSESWSSCGTECKTQSSLQFFLKNAAALCIFDRVVFCRCDFSIETLSPFWTRPIDRRCMSVRIRTRHEELPSNWIRETALLSQERSVASKVLLKMHCDSRQNHRGTTSQSHWKNTFHHSN